MLSGQRLESQRLASQELPEQQDPGDVMAEDDEPPPEQRRRSIGHPPTVPPDNLYRYLSPTRHPQHMQRYVFYSKMPVVPSVHRVTS